jgi:two-component system, chemotaxis family, sensor kinase CheA
VPARPHEQPRRGGKSFMSDGDEEILKEFLVESYENLDHLDRQFVALETDPTARERIADIFRAIHTIKGTSGFLGLPKLEALAHAGESLLSRLRDGALTLTPEITTALLAMVDGVRTILKHVEESSGEGPETYGPVIDTLARFTATEQPAVADVVPPLGQLLVAAGEISHDDLAAALQQQKSDPRKLGEILMEQGTVGPAALATALERQVEARTGLSDASIRVDVGLLDKLMNLVGELVLARNQILQFGTQSKDTGFIGTSQRLNLITTELQEGVMKTRMQPIGNIWSKLPRVVRDLSMACGKQVRVEMDGKETDLDRTIIEAIKDPLTHIVRNSVDHGIESPEVRVAKGKPVTGRLGLRAFHEGGQVNIEISDDGAGLDPDKLKKKAIEKGLVTPERAASMSEREVMGLIFLPGFSTAAQVTNVSGRGVGMDVVRTNIEKIGGTVDVQSALGRGTSLKIKIPLTLAIIPALIVSSGGERFAIPQVSLLELVRLEGEQARLSVESIHGAPVYRLRGQLLPLVYLNRVLQLTEPADGPINIVVVRADDTEFGLVVDGVNDTEEIVVKPLGKELKWLSTFAGATIMGDGRVALILDVLGIAQRANVVSEVRDRSLEGAAAQAEDKADDKQALLLFRVREGTRMAIPLSMVARLEEFPRSRLERTGSGNVVQYRGEIIPLIDLRTMLGGAVAEGADAEGPLQVVVSSERGRSVGLVVERILDIVEESVVINHRSTQKGLLGAAVIQGRVTDFLDVHDVIRDSDPTFFDQPDAA